LALPFSLGDALARLENAPVLEDYFGAEAVRFYRETKQAEFARFRKRIGVEEYDWYL
jgi:glutamine synthetase